MIFHKFTYKLLLQRKKTKIRKKLHTNPYTTLRQQHVSPEVTRRCPFSAFEDENIVCHDWMNQNVKIYRMVHPIMTNYIFIRKSGNGHRWVTEGVKSPVGYFDLCCY